MGTIRAGDFVCPKGFQKEDVISQLYLEDLDDDTELWLVRVPSDIDSSSLENQEITLGGETNHIASGDNKYELIAEACEMPNLCLVLPQKESKQLRAVQKPIKGTMFISESIMDNCVPAVQVKLEPGANIEANNSPSKSKRRKSGEKGVVNVPSEQDLSSMFDPTHDENELTDSQKKLSKKHKKKKSLIKSEPCSEIDEFPNCDSQA